MSPLARLFFGTVALVALYFAVPVDVDRSMVVRVVFSIVCLALATFAIGLAVGRQVRNEGRQLYGLALPLVGAALAFALTDYIIAYVSPGQFVGLQTRLDGLYFALTTLATVGYGDV